MKVVEVGDTKPYIELEYIESTGTQYIDTGIKPYITQFESEFALTTINPSTNGYVAGVYNAGNRYYTVSLDLIGNKFRSADKSNTTIILGNSDTNKHHIIYNNYDNKVIFDNIEKGTVTNLPSVSEDNLYLFALHGNQQEGSTQYLVGRIYYVKIIDKLTSTLIGNFIPVKRKSDNEICLYDKVTETFFTNQGTGVFIAGPVKDTSLESMMNIFVQTTEPIIKKGIWLQADETPECYTFDKNVYIGGQWMPDGQYTDIPYRFNNGGIALVGTDVYIFGSSDSNYSRYAYKYNTLTNAYTRLTNVPR